MVVAHVDLEPFAIAQAGSLELTSDGTPTRPLVLVDLTRPVDGDPQAVAAAVRQSLSLVIGVATAAIHPTALPVVDALTLSVVADGEPAGRSGVWAADLTAAVAVLTDAVSRRPRAAVVLGQVLRQAEVLPVRQALAAEAAAYSMLLGGPELAGWLAGRTPTAA